MSQGIAIEPTISLKSIGVQVGDTRILDQVTATVPAQSVTAIIGPNGAGKTTLLMAILRQIPFEGDVIFAGSQRRPPVVGYVPQRFDFDRSLPVTVMEFLVSSRQRWPLWMKMKRSFRELAHWSLAAVNGSDLATQRLGTLSGGELQRVLLANALQQKPDILILDEPSANVDPQGGNLLCELLEDLHARLGFTQVMVTHDLALVNAHATHVICLNRRVIAEGTPQILTSELLSHTFGLHGDHTVAPRRQQTNFGG